jgi:hypothetical protein
MFFDDENEPQNELAKQHSVPPPPRAPSPLAHKLVWDYVGRPEGTYLFYCALFLVVLLSALVPKDGVPLTQVLRDVVVDLTGKQVEARIPDRELFYTQSNTYREPVTVRVVYSVDGRDYAQEVDTNTYFRVVSPSEVLSKAAVVEYSRLYPGIARLAVRSSAHYGKIIVWAAGMFFGTFVVLWSVRRVRRGRKAFRSGTPVLAQVTTVGRVWWMMRRKFVVTSMRQHGQQVRWQFEVGGVRYTGSLYAWDSTRLNVLAGSGELVVLYLPENPRVNTAWVEDLPVF